jgi:glycerol-1-phosphate dehydrogenase [NAD(P)+]
MGLKSQHPDLEVLAVGGGLAVDAAKYLAHNLARPLTCLPTMISCDAFLTAEVAVRAEGSVRYLDAVRPERLVLDLEQLAQAPTEQRAAGICDLLAITTALWDWEYAEELGQNPPEMELVPWAADAAQALLAGALECAAAAGAGDPQGLKQLFDLLAMEVQLCNQLGHPRPVEGSEHFFAAVAETHLGKARPHANLVGPGILQMAARQDQEMSEIQAALQACHIPLDELGAEVVAATLASLPDYVRAQELPYSIAHEIGQT